MPKHRIMSVSPADQQDLALIFLRRNWRHFQHNRPDAEIPADKNRPAILTEVFESADPPEPP